MRIRIGLIIALIMGLFMVVGFNSYERVDTSGDWQWSDENIEVMEKSWCDYNYGRDFAEKNCVEYWK